MGAYLPNIFQILFLKQNFNEFQTKDGNFTPLPRFISTSKRTPKSSTQIRDKPGDKVFSQN